MSDKQSAVIQKSMGWSFFSEILAKFITPITNMLLARILTPSDFGVLAICNLLVSFVDIITDAGFGKYLVQADIDSDEDQDRLANVAFWSNFILSVVLFFLIVFNRMKIAILLGGSEYTVVICVASFQLILTSISSTQTALFRRRFGFKKLFMARITIATIPLIIAVPIAYFTKSYWALIIGTLSSALVNSIMLTILSPWRPRFYYSFDLLKRMFSFSFWSLCEGLAHWFIFWFDTFLVTQYYSAYYVGIYKNSANMTMSIMGMITASMSPVLLAVLSRVKNDKNEFEELYLTIQRIVLYLIVPMGICLFCYRKAAIYILLGSQWNEASNVLGAWGLMMMCSIIFYSFPAELYKSKGIPKILFCFQLGYIVFMLPICIAIVSKGFWTFVYVRCLCVLEQIFLSLFLIKKYFSISPSRIFSNMFKPFLCSCSILLTSFVFSFFIHTKIQHVFAMLISMGIYSLLVILFCKKDLVVSKERIQKAKL